MSALWDPRSVLDITPPGEHFTCVGITKKHTRCKQSMFSGADRSEASKILSTIALLDPASQRVCDTLPYLAHLTLCPRWHRQPGYCQVTQTVQKWLRSIAIYCASYTAPSPATSSQTRGWTPARSVSSTAVRFSEQTRTIRSPSPPSPDIVDEIQAPRAYQRSTSQYPGPIVSTPASFMSRPPPPPTFGTTTALPTSPATPARQNNAPASTSLPITTTTALTTPPATLARQNNASTLTSLPTNTTISLSTPPATPARGNSTSVPALLPTNTTTTLPTLPATSARENNALAPTSLLTNTNSSPSQHRDAVNNSLTLTPSVRAPAASPSTPCSQPHRVRRKPVTEDCAVCLEPICCLDEAVWCRAQCGQNIHRECFAEWRRQSLRQARETSMDEGEEDRLDAVKCMFCRATWKWEWQD